MTTITEKNKCYITSIVQLQAGDFVFVTNIDAPGGVAGFSTASSNLRASTWKSKHIREDQDCNQALSLFLQRLKKSYYIGLYKAGKYTTPKITKARLRMIAHYLEKNHNGLLYNAIMVEIRAILQVAHSTIEPLYGPGHKLKQ